MTLLAPDASADALAKPYDFDGNGYPDLAVGAPHLRISSVHGAGGVVILPASSSGLSHKDKIITQSSRGVPGVSEEYDEFGYARASADFDRDGYADLAIGQPGESVGSLSKVGAVTVVYGSSRGLNTSRSVGMGRPGGAVDGAWWGYSLVAGDFDDDSYPDLAVGAPRDWPQPRPPEDGRGDGTVRILWGGAAGLRTAGSRVLHGQGGERADAGFGEAVAATDLDADGDTDLVVGALGDGTQEEAAPGSVSYCAGEPGGPNRCRQLAYGDEFGGLSAIAAGNMSGDSRPEIAVGVPDYEELDEGPGGVVILQLNTGAPVTVARRSVIRQSSAGVPGSDEPTDLFGYAVALGDVDHDGYADLVAGAPGENNARGRVTVIHGAADGWRTTGNYGYSQATRGIPGASEEGDFFGVTVTLFDHDRDGLVDLTVGAAGENDAAGAITVLDGSAMGFTTKGSQTFGVATLGYRYPKAAQFGNSLGR